jgi:hypothetical protein
MKISQENPAELEYRKARALMNAQELAYQVSYKGLNYFIKEFQRFQNPTGPGFKTAVYLTGLPDLIPATDIEIKEPPK